MADSKTIDEGGPAFPVLPPVDETGRFAVDYPYPDPGMSLRDWFAGQALAGSLAGVPGSHLAPEHLAPDCYAFADAMIAARKGGAL